ncbi:MAG: GNAT family N-acetyltransferase [Ruminococcus sp.]|nr:GNAT family N-acetyltransferase [Ruminococcus sp.]MBR0302924.1 GNAT family N-acetyltransferase [Clostridia bacterium]
MNHIGTKTLETGRLILRRYQIEDAKDAFENWMNSEIVTKYLTWSPHRTIEESRAYIQDCCIGNYGKDDFYLWVIVLKDTGACIGSISVNEIQPDVDCCEIGYCMSDRYWGQGIMPEAFSAVIRFLFEEVGFNRIQSTHDVNNPASGRVMEKCGLKYEGTLRQFGRNNQGICDSVYRAILKDEYFASR